MRRCDDCRQASPAATPSTGKIGSCFLWSAYVCRNRMDRGARLGDRQLRRGGRPSARPAAALRAAVHFRGCSGGVRGQQSTRHARQDPEIAAVVLQIDQLYENPVSRTDRPALRAAPEGAPRRHAVARIRYRESGEQPAVPEVPACAGRPPPARFHHRLPAHDVHRQSQSARNAGPDGRGARNASRRGLGRGGRPSRRTPTACRHSASSRP